MKYLPDMNVSDSPLNDIWNNVSIQANLLPGKLASAFYSLKGYLFCGIFCGILFQAYNVCTETNRIE